MQEKENILRILRETKEAVELGDNLKIKELSNQTIHTATITQDPDNITVAVLVYTLSKFLERPNYQTHRGWKIFFNNFLNCIDKAEKALQLGKLEEFRRQLTHIRKGISSLQGNFRKHIQEVFRKAQVNKASRIYEHGISMEQTANLLGITLWELAEYSGATGVGDVNESITESERERIKNIQEFFK